MFSNLKKGVGGIHTNVCNWPVFSEMFSSWGVSTFACVDLATVWSRTRRFHTFFFFNFDTTGQILVGIYSLICRIKTLFCKKLEASNYQFSEIHFFFASSARPGFYFEVTHG